MGADRLLPDLSLISLRLVSVSAETLRDRFRGGRIRAKFDGESKTADDDVIDRDHPLLFSLGVHITGIEKDGEHGEDEDEQAFRVQATMSAAFVPSGDDALHCDDPTVYHDWMAAQIYLPLRAYIETTLQSMEIRVRLPLQVPADLKENAIKASAPV